MHKQRRMKATLLFAILWAAAVSVGLVALLRHEAVPGANATAPWAWPATGALELDAHVPTLVLFAHPRCPCSHATLDELALLMAHCQGRVRAHVFFFQPHGAGANWSQTALTRDAAAIQGVKVAMDRDASLARHFGATTSGHVFLFEPSGRCLFSGGITAGRGHGGENAGRSAVEAWVLGQRTEITNLPVFGCPLYPPSIPQGDEG